MVFLPAGVWPRTAPTCSLYMAFPEQRTPTLAALGKPTSGEVTWALRLAPVRKRRRLSGCGGRPRLTLLVGRAAQRFWSWVLSGAGKSRPGGGGRAPRRGSRHAGSWSRERSPPALSGAGLPRRRAPTAPCRPAGLSSQHSHPPRVGGGHVPRPRVFPRHLIRERVCDAAQSSRVSKPRPPWPPSWERPISGLGVNLRGSPTSFPRMPPTLPGDHRSRLPGAPLLQAALGAHQTCLTPQVNLLKHNSKQLQQRQAPGQSYPSRLDPSRRNFSFLGFILIHFHVGC